MPQQMEMPIHPEEARTGQIQDRERRRRKFITGVRYHLTVTIALGGQMVESEDVFNT